MQLGIILLVFVVIFISELPDKSLFASLILGTRYPARIVWLGAASAFLIHVIIAVTAGRLLTLLPHRVLESVIATLFLLGALLLFFGKHGLEPEPDKADHDKSKHSISLGKVYVTAFSVTFLGEWGDITQITTANYAAKYHHPWSVGLGALAALWTVTALAVTFGKKALLFIPPKLLQRITGFVLLGFAIASAISAIR
jgi:putative Ca2+/H+ antiporter (TMEM165/GDT1 family)